MTPSQQVKQEAEKMYGNLRNAAHPTALWNGNQLVEHCISSFISGFEYGQKWIRVEDGLPERSFSGPSVLCYNGNYIYVGYMKFDVWYNQKHEPVDIENGWAVTHWLPLPSPPTTDKK